MEVQGIPGMLLGHSGNVRVDHSHIPEKPSTSRLSQVTLDVRLVSNLFNSEPHSLLSRFNARSSIIQISDSLIVGIIESWDERLVLIESVMLATEMAADLTLYNLHPSPFNQHPTSCTLNPTTFALQSTPAPYVLHPHLNPHLHPHQSPLLKFITHHSLLLSEGYKLVKPGT